MDPSPRYVVQHDGGVHEYEPAVVRDKLREGELNGLEMARWSHEPQWRPLHDFPVFGEAVPHTGDPRLAAHRRRAGGFVGHATFYGMTLGVLAVVTTPIPWPVLVWGLFVGLHGVTVAGSLVEATRALGRRPALGPAPTAALPAAAEPDAPQDPFARAIAAVRELAARGPEDRRAALSAHLDAIAAQVDKLDERRQRLQRETGASEQAAIEAALALARQELADLGPDADPEDRLLAQRRLEVVEGRAGALSRAAKVLRRLDTRRDLAVQQLERLRVDMTRAEASELDGSDASDRLAEIQLDIDALDEADAALRSAT